MKISVVMPARDAAATIREAAESILSQSHSDFELVLVDHNSQDETGQIMRDLATRDDRVSVHSCRGSFIDACNLAWQKSSGDLVARMDSDDISDPNRIAQQIAFLQNHPELGGCASCVRILKRLPDGTSAPPDQGYADYEKWINSVRSPQQILIERFVDSPIPNPTVMLRRELLEKYCGYRDKPWAEDYDLWLRLLQDGIRIGKLDEVLLDWFDGEDRATRTVDRYSLENFQRAKAHFLAKLDLVQERGIVISGAGPIGKKFARFLEKEGIEVHGFVEVNPKQIGGEAAGKPVFSIDEIPRWENRAVIVSAVGQPGARDRTRELLAATSFVEGLDFFCVA